MRLDHETFKVMWNDSTSICRKTSQTHFFVLKASLNPVVGTFVNEKQPFLSGKDWSVGYEEYLQVSCFKSFCFNCVLSYDKIIILIRSKESALRQHVTRPPFMTRSCLLWACKLRTLCVFCRGRNWPTRSRSSCCPPRTQRGFPRSASSGTWWGRGPSQADWCAPPGGDQHSSKKTWLVTV